MERVKREKLENRGSMRKTRINFEKKNRSKLIFLEIEFKLELVSKGKNRTLCYCWR